MVNFETKIDISQTTQLKTIDLFNDYFLNRITQVIKEAAMNQNTLICIFHLLVFILLIQTASKNEPVLVKKLIFGKT